MRLSRFIDNVFEAHDLNPPEEKIEDDISVDKNIVHSNQVNLQKKSGEFS